MSHGILAAAGAFIVRSAEDTRLMNNMPNLTLQEAHVFHFDVLNVWAFLYFFCVKLFLVLKLKKTSWSVCLIN